MTDTNSEMIRLSDLLSKASAENAKLKSEVERQASRLRELLDDRNSLNRALIRFQGIARDTDRALVCITNGTTPDIDAIQDGCIKIHMRQMLEKVQAERNEFRQHLENLLVIWPTSDNDDPRYEHCTLKDARQYLKSHP